MIHNIIYKNYKNTKTRNRFNILSNYLSSLSKSSKFVNKYRIKEAVKNINDELEDAQAYHPTKIPPKLLSNVIKRYRSFKEHDKDIISV